MKIERELFQSLVRWKASPNRKPLILKGVRQCGKTWLLKEFGTREFANTVYLNFERDHNLSSFFEGAYSPSEILKNLKIYTEQNIVPDKTLLVFDEIQTCPRAMASLKYFCEEAPEYVIASAGSLIGISLAAKAGFPVGKVDFLELTPIAFSEYLQFVNPSLKAYIGQIDLRPLPIPFVEKLSAYLQEYLTIGGMPAVVSEFMEHGDIDKTENELDAILMAYESDFSKHIPVTEVAKLHLLWNSIPVQFAKENRRFFYSEVRNGARAKDLEDALQWLVNASMVLRVNNVEMPELPLKAFEERKTFKLFPADVGVLRKLASLPPSVLLNQKDVFGTFKGKLAENYVLQQLHAQKVSPICYWTNPTGNAEVDFLVQHDDMVIPIETKSGLNLKAQSLRTYREKYNPRLAVRTSMSNLRLDDGLLNIPLYLMGEFPRLLKMAVDSGNAVT